jgi:ubiquinone/menaquinone biosynthesis C-methylase UbiE
MAAGATVGARLMVSIADVNRASFSLQDVTSYYSKQHGLDAAENAIFRKILDQNARIDHLLDLGVGAGRTTEILRGFTRNYYGVDFSPEMIDQCRKRFPDLHFLVGDARDLSVFTSDSFDVVLFSFNGIDYVDHAGRIRVLAEVYRVLRPGGFFIVSSHNRDAEIPPLWRSRPIWFAMCMPLLALSYRNHLRLRHHEVVDRDYEIRNDSGSGWRMMTYYIDMVKQVEQLTTIGFRDIEVFDLKGKKLDIGPIDRKNAWLTYLCTK